MRKADTQTLEGVANGANGGIENGDDDDDEEEEPGMMPDEEVTRDVRYVLDDPEVWLCARRHTDAFEKCAWHCCSAKCSSQARGSMRMVKSPASTQSMHILAIAQKI